MSLPAVANKPKFPGLTAIGAGGFWSNILTFVGSTIQISSKVRVSTAAAPDARLATATPMFLRLNGKVVVFVTGVLCRLTWADDPVIDARDASRDTKRTGMGFMVCSPFGVGR
jgi:hypothetical protein